MSESPVVVDARGTLCPVPIIRLARAAGTLPVGSLVALLSDDPAAEHDVPAWCRLRGHALLAVAELVDADAQGEDGPGAQRAASEASSGPEPHVPNPAPAQALRHLIRLGAPR
ncbi:MAG TPA: sulfurtransferase TusA family protein [Candidatus Nanopelagicales bacterium]